MDNSPETKKNQATTASAAPANSATVKATPPTSAPVNKPAATPSTAPAKSAPASDYKTANIGQWKSKQEDYFAKQNKERSEKKAKKKATFKKIFPFALVFGILIVIGLGTWGVISLVNYINRPTIEETASDPSIISGNSSEAIKNYQDYLQRIYNDALASAMAEEGTDIATGEAKKKANEAMSEAVANTANTEAGEKYRDAMLLSEMLVYYDTWQCDNILHLEDQINPSNLNLQGQYRYNLALQNCYQVRGDTKRADELWKTVTELYSQVYNGDTGTLREGVEE